MIRTEDMEKDPEPAVINVHNGAYKDFKQGKSCKELFRGAHYESVNEFATLHAESGSKVNMMRRESSSIEFLVVELVRHLVVFGLLKFIAFKSTGKILGSALQLKKSDNQDIQQWSLFEDAAILAVHRPMLNRALKVKIYGECGPYRV